MRPAEKCGERARVLAGAAIQAAIQGECSTAVREESEGGYLGEEDRRGIRQRVATRADQLLLLGRGARAFERLRDGGDAVGLGPGDDLARNAAATPRISMFLEENILVRLPHTTAADAGGGGGGPSSQPPCLRPRS